MTRRRAVLFDLDGTLTKPHLDFDAIRSEIGLPPGPILESIATLTAPNRTRAEEILVRHEWAAAHNAVAQDRAAEVVEDCRRLGYATAVMTRNARLTTEHVLKSLRLEVDAVRTREDGAIKPSPEPVLGLCVTLNADPRRSWVIGDFLFDILSGRAAGARTVLMVGDADPPDYASLADHTISKLAELLPILS